MRMTTLLKIGICALPLLWAGAASAQGYGEPGINPSQNHPSTQPQQKMEPPTEAAPPTAPAPEGQLQQPTSKVSPTAENALTPQEFVNKAAVANLLEVRMGQLAVDKGSTKSVKKMGQEMIDGHTQANAELRKIAAKSGLDMPSTLTPDKQDIYDHLSSLSGTQFDDAYTAQVQQSHADAISLFNQQAKATTNPDLTAYANKLLPALKQHENMAGRASHKM